MPSLLQFSYYSEYNSSDGGCHTGGGKSAGTPSWSFAFKKLKYH